MGTPATPLSRNAPADVMLADPDTGVIEARRACGPSATMRGSRRDARSLCEGDRLRAAALGARTQTRGHGDFGAKGRNQPLDALIRRGTGI